MDNPKSSEANGNDEELTGLENCDNIPGLSSSGLKFEVRHIMLNLES